MITFQPVSDPAERDPKVPSAKPSVVKWWWLATPEPDYVLVVIRVTEVVNQDTIKCMLLGPRSGEEVDGPVEVDLTNQSHVWRGPPSTFVHEKIEINKTDHVVMCFTEKWLEDKAKNVAAELKTTMTGKWPWGEDEYKRARAAVDALAKKLRERNEMIAAMAAEFAKLRVERQQLAAMEDEFVTKLRACRFEPEEIESFQRLLAL
jgi:hypothetical protein